MELKTIYGIAALLLLSLTGSVKADDDFKQKFGNEFITDMKHYHAELLHQNMKHLEELYTRMLAEFEPTPAEEKSFKSRLDDVKEIQDSFSDTISVDTVAKVKEFGQSVLFELVLFRFNPAVLQNPVRQRFIKTALEDSANLEKKDLKLFQHRIYKRYHEMYETIPKEELEQNPEYTEIDKAMERTAGLSESEAGSITNILQYLSIFELLANFFDVPEYKEIFTK